MTNKFAIVTPSMKEGKTIIGDNYLEYVEKSGFTPLIVTPQNVSKLLELKPDLLVLTGGADINPNLFGDDNLSSYNVNNERDNLELYLLEHFYTLEMPVFGICRGLQMMFRFLEQKQETPLDCFYSQHIRGHNQGDLNVDGKYTTHKVFFTKKDVVTFVNSFHHQGVMTTDMFSGTDMFSIDAYADCDRNTVIIEQFTFRNNWRAVQWHPERLVNDCTLSSFKEFLDE